MTQKIHIIPISRPRRYARQRILEVPGRRQLFGPLRVDEVIKFTLEARGSLTIEMALATPIVQTAEFVPGSKIKLRVPEGDPNVFRLPDAADPELSRAYLQAAPRARPGAANIDVTVVLDGSTALFHGPPTCWEAGVAQRVLRGELRLGIIRVQRAGSPKAPRASSAQADAASSSDPTLSCVAKDAQPSATAATRPPTPSRRAAAAARSA